MCSSLFAVANFTAFRNFSKFKSNQLNLANGKWEPKQLYLLKAGKLLAMHQLVQVWSGLVHYTPWWHFGRKNPRRGFPCSLSRRIFFLCFFFFLKTFCSHHGLTTPDLFLFLRFTRFFKLAFIHLVCHCVSIKSSNYNF